MKALSIRQPWAWLIVNGYKSIENRTRNSHYRGPLLIHASAGMTRADYEACVLFCSGFDCGVPEGKFPAFNDLQRGGIVGQVEMLGCVSGGKPAKSFSGSQWYTGDFGYVFVNPKVLPFQPCKGQLNFFSVDLNAELSDLPKNL